jgi:predicted phage tail protein
MKRIILHGEMAELFAPEVVVDANTFNGILNGISANHPQFRSYFIQKIIKGVDYVFVDSDNKEVSQQYIHLESKDNVYHMHPRAMGAAGAGAAGIQGITGFAASFGMSWLMNKITKAMKGDEEEENEIIKTKSYIYSQNENRVEQGSPVPIIYGQLRVGSKIISSSIQNYDYDNDEAFIYKGKPQSSRLARLGADYDFIQPKEVRDLRDSTPEAFGAFKTAAKDSSKRFALAFSSSSQAKLFRKNAQDNEATNAGFGDELGGEHVVQGPSIGSAKYQNSSSTKHVDLGGPKNARPFLYPLPGQLDANCRPASSREVCVQDEKSIALSYTSPSSTMKVGSRGSFQKLESIGIYKSLEILSEGPIEGLAGPITGSRDNGYSSFPSISYPSLSIPVSSRATISALKYDTVNGGLNSHLNTHDCAVLGPGSNYYPRNGTFSISGNGAPYDATGFSITVSKPAISKEAVMGGISFDRNSPQTAIINNTKMPAVVGHVSNTKLFTLRTGDGSIHPNTNSTLIDVHDGVSTNNKLPASYFKSENVDGVGITGVFQLSALENNKGILGTDYSIGVGYQSATKTVNISPIDFPATFNTTLRKLTGQDRVSKSKVLDMATDATQLLNAKPQFIPDLLEDYKKRTEPLLNVGWDEAVRIYLDSPSAFEIEANKTKAIIVDIGSYISNRTNHLVQIRITLDEYSNLGDVKATFTGAKVAIAKVTLNNYNAQFNSAAVNKIAIYENAFDYTLTQGKPVPLGVLLRDKNFANVVYGKFVAESWIPGQEPAETTVRTYNTEAHGGGKYLKWCPGTGSIVNPSVGISDGGTAGEGGKANLDLVKILEDGSIPNDNSTNFRGDKVSSKGFYYNNHCPRVTVFCFRKSTGSGGTFASYNWMPTNIDCVAKVNNSGKVSGLQLLFVPDEPVFDTTLRMYTPIYPQDVDVEKPVVFAETDDVQKANYKYQDLGFYCKIDDSSSSKSVGFMINTAGQIKDDLGNAIAYDSSARRNINTIETTWTDHIKHNTPNTNSNYAAGIFNVHGKYPFRNVFGGKPELYTVKQTIELTSSPDGVSPPTSAATVEVNVEVLDLKTPHPAFPTKSYRVTGISTISAGLDNWISTGRPDFIKVTSKGGGYTKWDGASAAGQMITQSIFNQGYGVELVEPDGENPDSNQGYRPNSNIVFYGRSKFRQGKILLDAGSVLNQWEAITAKFKAKVNDTGNISSIETIDPGYGFDPMLNPEDCSFDPHWTMDIAAVVGLIADPDPGRNLGTGSGNGFLYPNAILKPSWFFPKGDLVLEALVSGGTIHIRSGKIEKFYVKDPGKGFTLAQSIPEIFPLSKYTPPTFLVDINSNGGITGIRIKNSETGLGYSLEDSEVRVKISPGGAKVVASTNNEATDPHAWARSIYLNDVPIRDRNDRFNYSKFDFDMRLGNAKNGNGESHLDKTEIQPIDNILIKKEFVLPSYTTIKNYKLFGPRNDGEKDYYFSYTVKNPNVTNISLSIKINKLHYIYEGDQAILYMNLIPVLLAGAGYMAGKSAISAILARVAGPPDPVLATGTGSGGVPPCGGPFTTAVTVTGTVTAQPTAIPEALKAAAESALILAGGILVALGAMLIASLLSCRKIPWLCFKVGEVVKNSGEIWPAKMHIAVEYGVEGEDMEKKTYQFQGCATSDYVKDILIENLPSAGGYKNNYKNRIIKVYRETREMDPVAGGIVESRYQIEAELAGVTEYVEGYFSYPNTAIIGTRVNSKDHPSVPKREYLVKGMRIQIPNNYDPISGIYSPATWEGIFKAGINAQWTSNPSWIVYDLLINQRYGMGKYGVKESDIDKWSFYTFSKRCDEKVDVVIDGESTSERRHMCNLYIDSQKEAYSYINVLLDIYNCSLNFSSGKLYITQDAPKAAVMIFTNSNVSEEGFAYSVVPKTDRITACSVDFVDERDNYMKKTEYVEDPEGVSKYGYSHSNIEGHGITRRGEAHRLAWHKILTRQIENEIITFKTGIEASYLKIGDVVQVVDNKKISSHSGGKITKVVSGTKIEIDIPASFLVDVTEIFVEVPVQSDDIGDTSDSSEISNRRVAQYKEYTINGRSGFELTLGSSLDSSIEAGSNWIIKNNATDKIKPKEYKIEILKEVSELSYEITALEYVREKFADIDASTSLRDGTNLEEREYYGHTVIV